MAERRSIWRWISFVNVACIASVLDAQHYFKFGTVNTWLGGWQPASEHPWVLAFNILLDVGSVFGMVLIVRKTVVAWWKSRPGRHVGPTSVR